LRPSPSSTVTARHRYFSCNGQWHSTYASIFKSFRFFGFSPLLIESSPVAYF
jgi:hypothetical protein